MTERGSGRDDPPDGHRGSAHIADWRAALAAEADERDVEDWGEGLEVSVPRAERIEDDAEASRPPPLAPEREIGIWLEDACDGEGGSGTAGRSRVLLFKVGGPVEGSLVGGEDARVPDSDVPREGLLTHWTVVSRFVELREAAEVRVDRLEVDGAPLWQARFSLLVRADGDSATRALPLIASAAAARLDVIVHVGGEVYRHLALELGVDEAQLARKADQVRSPLSQTGHAPPSGRGLSVVVLGQLAWVTGEGSEGVEVESFVPWTAAVAASAPKIVNVRRAAERFMYASATYLDGIDPDNLRDRLEAWDPTSGWSEPQDGPPDERCVAAWAAVAAGEELYELAHAGRRLFDFFMPNGSEIRGLVGALPPGHRLNVAWTPMSGPGWVAHVPWGMMFLGDLPPPGRPLDPMGFLGLRFRLGYTAHDAEPGSKALCAASGSSRAHLLYWGDEPGDEAGVESKWQRRRWGGREDRLFLPADAEEGSRKAALLRSLHGHATRPVGVLYLFCRCNGVEGEPVLRFGSTSELPDTLRQSDLGTTRLADRPLVFANACATSGTDPYMANELESLFFDRGCRGYLGTETKVTIGLASRFADVFFHFFDCSDGRLPMAAGEAVARARLFLWANYRNVGGLLYTYVNQYELFMASGEELTNWRGKGGVDARR